MPKKLTSLSKRTIYKVQNQALHIFGFEKRCYIQGLTPPMEIGTKKIFVKSITSLPELLIFSQVISISVSNDTTIHPSSCSSQKSRSDASFPHLIQSQFNSTPNLTSDSLHLYYTSLVHHCVLPRLLYKFPSCFYSQPPPYNLVSILKPESSKNVNYIQFRPCLKSRCTLTTPRKENPDS